jgi:hypothetical protein
MVKLLYPKILLFLAFLTIAFAFPFLHLNAGAQETAGNAPTSPSSNAQYFDAVDPNRPASPDLLAQAEAQAGEHRCVGRCRRFYEERMAECNNPRHEFHHRCERWAREREQECLDNCYREFPR